ncbi:hypothetical protein [Zoogloea sp.]|uniref:hypothetical protein n=1 Tax=Zoogloea sp. TaxID=49181 RepID=UPI0035B2D776
MQTSARSSDAGLIQRWNEALRFRIGVDGVTGLDQLPDVASFPDKFPIDEFGIGRLLGEVLGVAALKLFRTCGTASPEKWSFDHIGQWLQAHSFADRMTDVGRIYTTHKIIDFSFSAPERLSVLNSFLDALSNDDLHRMAMDAVQGLPVNPDIFEAVEEVEEAGEDTQLNQLLLGFIEVLSIEMKASNFSPRYALGMALCRQPDVFAKMIICQFKKVFNDEWKTTLMGVLHVD